MRQDQADGEAAGRATGGATGVATGEAATGTLVLTRVLHALSDPVRLNIVRQLARDGDSSCASLDGGRPKSSMSHHFRVLREAGLVRTWSQGTTHMNALCHEAIGTAFPGLLAIVVGADG